jgi:glycosyltransferase involved in cell wall biosynthesis
MLGVESHFFIPDLTVSRRRGRKLLGVEREAEVVLHVGSCVARKNLPGLLAAIKRLVPAHPSICLVQVGGRFRTEECLLIEELGLQDRVAQHPDVSETELPDVYAAADVVAVPSLFEGFGFPVLEAFAVGVPVLATRNTSLTDFPDGMLESAGRGSVEEIEMGLSRVLDDRDAALGRAAVARHWARDKTWQRVARATARAYGATG